MKSLRRRLAQLENRDTSIDRLKNEITQLQEDVIDQRQTISTLEDQLANSLDAIDGLKEVHNRQQAKLDSLRQRLDRTRETLTNLQKENREIARMTRERLEDGDVKRRGGQVLITFQAGLLFEFGRAYIPEEARGRLDRVAKILKAFPDRPVRVYGHTDTTPVSPSNPYTSNWDLSSHRAVNVLKYLAYGRDVNKQRLGAVGFADRRPLVKNTTEKKRAQNRRVEIVMLPRNRRMVSADFDREESRSQNEQLRGQFEESVRTKNLRVRKGSLYVNLTEQLKFPTAEATLDTADREVLDKFGPIIEQYPDRPIRIQGHTDDLPMADKADYESNWELSAARAISVVKYLVKNYELRNHEIGASAMGQFHPLLPNTSDTNRQRNRRVEIILLPESYRKTSLDLGAHADSATQD
jgi:chemotaxis protein MotB